MSLCLNYDLKDFHIASFLDLCYPQILDRIYSLDSDKVTKAKSAAAVAASTHPVEKKRTHIVVSMRRNHIPVPFLTMRTLDLSEIDWKVFMLHSVLR